MLKHLMKMCSNNQKLKISIEGNIASGKSSIIDYLQKTCQNTDFQLVDSAKKIHLNIFTEPVNKWRNLNGSNLLELMYKDPKRWSFTFHSYVQLTMLENHLKMKKKQNKESDVFNLSIMERSLYSAKYCFLENMKKSNLMKPVEYEILSKWFHWMIENNDCQLDLIFYLRTSPETCLERLNQRGRSEEVSSISLAYLSKLHDLHESWLCYDSDKIIYKPKNIIVIDADRSLDDVCKRVEYETKYAASLAL